MKTIKYKMPYVGLGLTFGFGLGLLLSIIINKSLSMGLIGVSSLIGLMIGVIIMGSQK